MAAIDLEIVQSLERRAVLARQVGELGVTEQAGSLPPPPQASEPSLERALPESLAPEAVRSVLREVHAATRPLEAPVRVVYLGPEGGFGRAGAAMQFGQTARLTPAEDVLLVLDEVVRRRADFAVIPAESSAEGPDGASILALMGTDLVLVAKVEVAATLSLMSPTGELDGVDRVFAWAGDRIACQRYLTTSLERATVVDVRSPAAGCEMVRLEPHCAVIAPETFGMSLGLLPIQTNIADRADLSLRFGIVSARPASRTGLDTTACAFTVHDQPGALFDVLRHFAERGINLKTIQSRPLPGERWNYLFYVEVTGHVTDRPVVTALEAIKRQTRLLKVLGSFPS